MHGWQGESTDGPKGEWSHHPPITVGCSVVLCSVLLVVVVVVVVVGSR